MRSLLITGAIIMITVLFNGTLAQGQVPGQKAHPDAKWKVQKEWMEKFREEVTFLYDSIDQFNPQWQQLPGQQKKSARSIEI